MVVAFNIEVHFHAAEQFIKIFERQTVLLNDRLQFPVDRELRRLPSASTADISAPGGQQLAALFHRHRFIVGHIIHFPAKRIEGRHAVPLGLRQQHESQRQIGSALAGDLPAVLHALRRGRWLILRTDWWQATGFCEGGIARPMFPPSPPPFSPPVACLG